MMYRGIKSYVVRAGRVSPRQQQGLDVHLPQYSLPLTNESWDLSVVFARHAPTIVEIGFGMGASLLAMAQANPERNYIGIEVHQAGLGSLAADLHDRQITNVRLVAHDAVAVLQHQLADESLAGIQIFFPDPWPKKRHHKRRLIQADFVRLLVKKLKKGGFLHCATDWQEYAEHMLTVLDAESLLSNQQPEGGFIPRPSQRPLTKFEHRGERLGHGVWDLMFLKK